MLAGCVLLALLQNGPKALARGVMALPALWRADPERDMLLARATMTRVDHVAQLRGLQCTDRVRAANPFLALAIRKLADTETVDRFEMWAEQALADRRARHETAQKFWLSIADVAPALGMAGTIIGLVGIVLGTIGGVLLADNVTNVMHFLESIFGFELMPADIYYISDLPSDLRPGDVMRISGIAFVFCTIATLYPAWRASRTLPAEALRYE